MLLDKTDSYKVSHYLQFPDTMVGSSYYIESRSKGETLLFFGLQMILKKYFSRVPTLREVDEIGAMWEEHGLPFNYVGWSYISKLGYYPLTITAKPEGSLCYSGEPLVVVECTDPDVPWLAGWAETTLLQLWYPTTVATRSWTIKQIIKASLERTGTLESLPFKLHDFGYRGCSSQETAAIGGLAHLVNFMGTDTIPAVIAAKEYYGAKEMPAFSIPASEHSTITSWGRGNEMGAYNNMLDKFPSQLFACVSDSYDLTNAVKNIWGYSLRSKVDARDASLVIRPDSGEPVKIILRTLRECKETFGGTFNDKGFYVLPDNIRLIQGDGISGPSDVKDILDAMEYEGFSADNIAFGMGGGLLQNLNRDTYKFAMKMSAIQLSDSDPRSDGWSDVYKQPKDAAWKASKRGRQEVVNGKLVWQDGAEIIDDTLEEIRGRQ